MFNIDVPPLMLNTCSIFLFVCFNFDGHLVCACAQMHLCDCTCVSVSVNMDVHHMCVRVRAQVRGEPNLLFLRSHKYYF